MPVRLVVLGSILVLAALTAAWLWRTSTVEPLASFRDFPWTYITEAGTGPDQSRVIIHRGSISGPASLLDEASGQRAWPAYVHPDPAVIPLMDGRPCIFPVIPDGTQSRTPVIPSLRRPLTTHELAAAQRFLTPEGAERMAAFRAEMTR